MVQSKCEPFLTSSHIPATRLAPTCTTLCCCGFSSLSGSHLRCALCLCPRVAPFAGEGCVVSGWGLLSDNKPGATGSRKSQGAWKDGAGSRNSSNAVLRGSWVEGTGTKGSEHIQSHLSSSVRLPDALHCANISIISEASCNKDYPGRVLPTMVCAGVEGGGTDSCEVRAKGGLWVNVGNKMDVS